MTKLQKDAEELHKKILKGGYQEEMMLSIEYQTKGDFYLYKDNKKALEYLEKALKIHQKLGMKVYTTAIIQSNISVAYSQLGKTKEALEKAIIAKDIFEDIFYNSGKLPKESYNDWYKILGQEYYRISSYYIEYNDDKNIKKYDNLAMESYKKISSDYKEIEHIYEIMAKYYLRDAKFELALEYYNKALVAFKRVETSYYNQTSNNPLEVNDKNYKRKIIIKIYMGLATTYNILNNSDTTLWNLKQAIIYGEKITTKDDYLLANIYIQASEIYFNTNMFREAYKYIKKAFDNRVFFRNNNFEILGSSDKYKTLNHKDYNNVLSNLIHIVYKNIEDMTKKKDYRFVQPLLQTTFNDLINYKGEISNFNNIISIIEAKTDNQELKNNIKNLNDLNIKLSKEYQKFQENNSQIKNIKKQISDIEINLSKNSKEFKEFLGLEDITYIDISSNLTPNQLYIDFIRTDEYYYMFTLDSKGTPLFYISNILENEIKDFISNIKEQSKNIKYKAKEIYDMLGFKHLKNKTELIISPDGLLNLLPFEALYDGQKYLIETKTISYMSSAKEFVKGLKREIINNTSDIVAFGNANFDMKFDSETRGIPSLLTQNFSDLPATKNEIEAISKIYPNTKVYTKNEASVGNLLTIKNPKILHLATHGFYLKDKDNHPLEKVGLALSGATRASKVGDTRGIITALKISIMDLNYTELVVLSACESGLGDINSSDGVMNLSSAFIQAGARSVIMSLWKIDDKATSILIQDFYDNISKGQRYRNALREAKLKMIDKHPFYWSSLIISGI